MPTNNGDLQIKLARKYLKMKIMEDNRTFRAHESQRTHVYDLLSRTLEAGESNSAIIIGPRGCGKTTLLNSVLLEFGQRPNFEVDSIVVRLSGVIHTDDKLALKAITTQMSLDNAIGDRVFGSFSENLAFLLSCLKSGADRRCRSVFFLLDEFHVFCRPHVSQTLLYNLFDIAQSRQAPICVLGITCRLDVIELLEKRVKSRFSHRQIFIFPNSPSESDKTPFDERMDLFQELLSLPSEVSKPRRMSHKHTVMQISDEERSDEDIKNRKSMNTLKLENSLSEFLVLKDKKTKTKSSKKSLNNKIETEIDIEEEAANPHEVPHDILLRCNTSWKEFTELDPIFVSFWNENIINIRNDPKIIDILKTMYDIDVNEQAFRNILVQLVCTLSNRHPQLESSDVLSVCQALHSVDDKVSLLISLSILELTLVIAMMHHTQLCDGQPMNFEMVLNRYTKFVNSNSSSQTVPRAVVLKAFEHLVSLELVVPCGGSGLRQKEYQLHRLTVTNAEIQDGVKSYRALPTEILQWTCCSDY